ncbi:MAG: hypothetical protein AAFN77_23795 [Planctomycetota bacterium]
MSNSKQLTNLVIILPCHSMEDFPTHYTGEDAANLLSCWTSLWHPALLATCQRMPQWMSADNGEPCWKSEHEWVDVANEIDSDSNDSIASDEVTDQAAAPLVVVPTVSEPIVDSNLLLAADQDGVLVAEPKSRNEVAQAAAEHFEAISQTSEQIDPDLIQDFFALGYAYLQVQLMTRQLRYSSNLDEHEFEQAVIAAANAAVASKGQTEQSNLAADQLTACFDILLEEKNAYYPVEPQLCDIVLLSETTLGSSLDEELKQLRQPCNLLLTGDVAKRLHQQNPLAATQIRQKVEQQLIELIGGLQQELPDWLLDNKAIIRQLQRGRETLTELFGTTPRVFMRRSFGTSPALPGILEQLGFIGAIHAPLEKCGYPRSASGVIRWTGHDEASILAIGDRPLNAADPATFLGLGIRLGEMIDSAHMATAAFVRWPNRSCESFDDVKRIAEYTPLFGEFMKLDSFFESVYDPGYGESFTADEYRSPYLKQAIAKEQVAPITRFVRFHELSACLESSRRLIFLAETSDIPLPSDEEDSNAATLLQQIDQCETELDMQTAVQAPAFDAVHEKAESILQKATQRFGQPLKKTSPDLPQHDVLKSNSVMLNLNSSKQTKRALFAVDSKSTLGSVRQKSPLKMVHQSATDGVWVLEAAGFSGVELTPEAIESRDAFKSDPNVILGNKLQNESFIVGIDESTGGVRSLNFHNQRLNLFTQQLAMRIPSETPGNSRTAARYTKMVADHLEVVEETRLSGAIRTNGRLVDQDNTVCEYVQTVRLTRGCSRIEFTVQVQPKVPFQSNWNHYICSRLAWKEEGARIVANSIDAQQHVTSEWFHGTRHITIGDDHTFALLSGGLPYHRRSNRRMLDSLLMMAGEQQTQFRFAIDIDQPYATAAAYERLLDSPIIEPRDAEQVADSALAKWLLHFNCKNVTVTRCQPILETKAVQLMLQETEGRAAKLTVRSRLTIEAAHLCRLDGTDLESLDVEAEKAVEIELKPYAATTLKVIFQK